MRPAVAVSGNRSDLYRSGTYSFDDLETSGLVGTDWVVYGYNAGQIGVLTVTGARHLVLCLEELVFGDARVAHAHLVAIDHPVGAHQARSLQIVEAMNGYKVLTTAAGGRPLVAYDLMLGASRDHNDGGLIKPPAYAIDGYVWEASNRRW